MKFRAHETSLCTPYHRNKVSAHIQWTCFPVREIPQYLEDNRFFVWKKPFRPPDLHYNIEQVGGELLPFSCNYFVRVAFY